MLEYSRLSKYKVHKIISLFCADVTATQAALLLGLNRKTINRYYGTFREAIYRKQMDDLAQFAGVVELDESYFGATRVRGRPAPRKRGRGTSKQPVFGVLERGGRVYTEIIPNAEAKTLQQVIRGKVPPDAVIHTDGWRGYNGLVDVGYDAHFRINKSKHFAQNGVHINGIESFWSFTKRRLAKFNGTKKNFHLHLKECEWRWNKTYDTMIKEIKKMMV